MTVHSPGDKKMSCCFKYGHDQSDQHHSTSMQLGVAYRSRSAHRTRQGGRVQDEGRCKLGTAAETQHTAGLKHNPRLSLPADHTIQILQIPMLTGMLLSQWTPCEPSVMLYYTDVDKYKAYSTLLLLISSFVCRLRQIPSAFSCRGAPAAVAAVHQAAKLTRLVKGML